MHVNKKLITIYGDYRNQILNYYNDQFENDNY